MCWLEEWAERRLFMSSRTKPWEVFACARIVAHESRCVQGLCDSEAEAGAKRLCCEIVAKVGSEGARRLSDLRAMVKKGEGLR